MTANKPRSLFARKDLTALLQAAPGSRPGRLTALDLTLLGIGCIMGTGVFVLTGRAAACYAGPAVVLSFLIAALAASLAAMCYAEFASMLPVAGSAYTYAYATMGELPAFVMGWCLALQYLVGAACVAVGWSGYAAAVCHSLGCTPWPRAISEAPLGFQPSTGLLATGAWGNLPAVAVIGAVCLLLGRGIEASARVNTIVVAIKMAVIGAFVLMAAPAVEPRLWQPFVPPVSPSGAFGFSGVLRASTLLFFAYLGFDAVSVAATETANPKRDVPIGILASLGICAVVYVAVALVLTGIVPYAELDVASPLALGVAALKRPSLAVLVDLGALAGLTSVLLVQLLALPRILQAMAADGLLPPSLAKVDAQSKVPKRLTYLAGCACALGAGFLPMDVLANLTSEGTLLVFFLVGLGVLLLRRQSPELVRRFRLPLGDFLIPGLCMLSALGLLAVAWRSLPGLLLWLAIGAAIYFGNARPRLAARDCLEK